MSSLFATELAATCSALGSYDVVSNKYNADTNTLEAVKDLIRYLRRDDESHDIRRQLGASKVLPTDLLPLLKSYWEETDLFDALLRLLVNLTTPALLLWNEELPANKVVRNYYMQIEDHLQSYKQEFADEAIWAVLSARLSKVLEIDYSERSEENSLVIERIFILIRNVLYVPMDPNLEKRPDNDASVHDQVLWALHRSGMLDIILYVSSSTNEQIYYMHILEILSFMLREQSASDLAQAALQRSESEKLRDEAELLAIRHRETNQKQQKAKLYNSARHSRFGGTFVLKSMKSISDNELIYHKPLNKLDELNFDVNKQKLKIPKNRLPIKNSSIARRSAFSIRLFLKEFCVEFLNESYNILMFHVKDNLARARAQEHDETYYLWTLRFFMEFNRCNKFEIKLVSETMSVQAFHGVQQQTEKYFDMIQTNKKGFAPWARRLHLALLAYRELLQTIMAMDKSPDGTVRDSATVIKNNIFYVLEYRELILTLLMTYDELKMSEVYLKDLIETQHIFLKMFESFCGSNESIVVQKKSKRGGRKKKGNPTIPIRAPELDLESRWDEAAPQLSAVFEGSINLDTDIVPFDAASDTAIDEQKSNAMKRIQAYLRNDEFENAIVLLRAARDVWPENDCFGSNNMVVEEEFLALREIFFADLGQNEPSVQQEQPIYDAHGEEEDEDEEESGGAFTYAETEIKLEDFIKRLAHPKIVRACGLVLRNFEHNSFNTNHCIVKLLHRIAFDCKMYVLLFQVSLFRTFQKIFKRTDMPGYKELAKFATYIIRQFIIVAETNKKVYMEALFWKSAKEAYDIQEGYGTFESKVKAKNWTEENEDELRRLFMEHQANHPDKDVIDWICENLIDNTRTRRAVLKKMKEMYLITNYKRLPPSKSGVVHAWSAAEEAELRELWEQFNTDPDPLDSIIPKLTKKRLRNRVFAKLRELNLCEYVVNDDLEPTSKSNKRQNGVDGGLENNNLDNNNTGTSAKTARNRKKKNTKNMKGKPKSKAVIFNSGELTKRLRHIVELGMTDALRWLRDSLVDAIEDLEDDESAGNIPLVPIMDYAFDAMENPYFQETLKGIGIDKPVDEQGIYWQISSAIPVETLGGTCGFLTRAIDNNFDDVEESTKSVNGNSDESSDEDIFDKLEGFHTTDDNLVSTKRSSADPDLKTVKVKDKLKNNTGSTSKKTNQRIVDDSESDCDEANISQPAIVSKNSTSRKTYSRFLDSDSDDGDSMEINNIGSTSINLSKVPENDIEGLDASFTKRKISQIVDSDSEDEVVTLGLTAEALRDDDLKRNRSSLGSDSENPMPKRNRVIQSSDDED